MAPLHVRVIRVIEVGLEGRMLWNNQHLPHDVIITTNVNEFSLFSQDLYCVRSDLGNLLKALGRLDEAKV